MLTGGLQGKSTVLKLLTRLYDPTEGQIFVDGRDIKSLRLEDLRETVAVLFQDYTLFPLSVSRDYLSFAFSSDCLTGSREHRTRPYSPGT